MIVIGSENVARSAVEAIEFSHSAMTVSVTDAGITATNSGSAALEGYSYSFWRRNVEPEGLHGEEAAWMARATRRAWARRRAEDAE